MIYDVENPDLGWGQAQKCGGFMGSTSSTLPHRIEIFDAFDFDTPMFNCKYI